MAGGKKKPYHLEVRFAVQANTAVRLREECSATGKSEWVDTRTRLRIHTLRGVSGSLIDILLPEYDNHADGTVCEIGRKRSSFDANERWRIAIRPYERASKLHSGKLLVEHQEDDHTAVIALWTGGGMWAQTFRRMPSLPREGDRRGIFMHHYGAYFWFLDGEDARQMCEMWAVLPHTVECDDISVLNRTASAALYDLARRSGWVKLTRRDKERRGLDLDGPQWVRVEKAFPSRSDNTSGCGEYTIRAANALAMYHSEDIKSEF